MGETPYSVIGVVMASRRHLRARAASIFVATVGPFAFWLGCSRSTPPPDAQPVRRPQVGAGVNLAAGDGGPPMDKTAVPPDAARPSRRVVGLAGNGARTFAVLTDSSISSWGTNEAGALGTGATEPVDHGTVNLPHAGNIERVTVGDLHACLKLDEHVYCWGLNDVGQLGAPRAQGGTASPMLVPELGQVRDVAAGSMFTCAIQAPRGTVACWGYGDNAQLGYWPGGLCNVNDRCERSPRPVPGIADVRQIALGVSHVCAVSQQGAVYCWGSNDFGQLGRRAGGKPDPVPRMVAGLPRVIAVSVGTGHSCAIAEDRSLWCWGDNRCGQLGHVSSERCSRGPCSSAPGSLPDGIAGVTQVVSKEDTTCALDAGGHVWCWGANFLGAALGVGGGACIASPKKVERLPRIQEIVGGMRQHCALDMDGVVWCWGVDGDGTLGFEPAPCGTGAIQDCAQGPAKVPL